MSKKLYVLGLVAIMLFMVGCGKQETNKNTVTVYDQQLGEVDNVTEDLSSYVYDLYNSVLKEIYGDDFEINGLIAVDENTVSYNGVEVSVDYIEELAYNLMTNK